MRRTHKRYGHIVFLAKKQVAEFRSFEEDLDDDVVDKDVREFVSDEASSVRWDQTRRKIEVSTQCFKRKPVAVATIVKRSKILAVIDHVEVEVLSASKLLIGFHGKTRLLEPKGDVVVALYLVGL